jgi:hypothetical protein
MAPENPPFAAGERQISCFFDAAGPAVNLSEGKQNVRRNKFMFCAV